MAKNDNLGGTGGDYTWPPPDGSNNVTTPAYDPLDLSKDSRLKPEIVTIGPEAPSRDFDLKDFGRQDAGDDGEAAAPYGNAKSWAPRIT